MATVEYKTLSSASPVEVLNDNDVLLGLNTGNSRIKISFANLISSIASKLVNFVTKDGSDILTNKLLSQPKINSNDKITVTGGNINHLTGLGTNVQTFIDNATSSISDINNTLNNLSIPSSVLCEIFTFDPGQLTNMSIGANNINPSLINGRKVFVSVSNIISQGASHSLTPIDDYTLTISCNMDNSLSAINITLNQTKTMPINVAVFYSLL